MENNPSVEINDTDIKKMGLEPEQVNEWISKNYNLTFSVFQQIYRTDSVFQQSQYGGNEKNVFDCISLGELNGRFKKVIGSDMDSYKNVICVTRVETELGTMIAGATGKGICLFEFADYKMLEMQLKQLIVLLKAPLVERESVHFDTLREQVERYFKGELREFSVPLDLAGTDFQVQAWLGLLNIPYGATISYAKQAEALGKPSAVRAVANANGKNRISIILPCHRVIGTNGTLTGYGGGIWRKKKLLELENANSHAHE
ncbi:MAG: methylated-DNA--[protein]-cysteine S-methyltransferase [Tannerella sp.]|nr:methylated-DNA--[protein]-cysteine S-methyltransferase [Tannerella sp.]